MRTTIIGAGNTGLAMAAHLTFAGNEVFLYDQVPEIINVLEEKKTIHCHGKITGDAKILGASLDINRAIEGSDLIIIMTPAFAHKDLAILLGQHLDRPIPIILSPGRTFGAIEFRHYFAKYNNSVKPIIAETQTVIHTARRISANTVEVFAIKDSVFMAAIDPDNTKDVLRILPKNIRKHFTAADSIIQTSIGNVGMILHCTPLLLNSGWTESPDSGFRHYWDGISPRIAKFIEKIDAERIAVSKALGFPVISTKEWLERSYHSQGDTLYERIRNTEAYSEIAAPYTLEHRYIYEDIPFGLVPLETLGKVRSVEMTNTSLIIDLASAMMEEDFRANGRNLKDFDIYAFYNILLER